MKDMSLEEREELLRSWRDSMFRMKRKLFKICYVLTIAIMVKISGDLHDKAIGYPARETRDVLYEGQIIDPFRYTMTEPPKEEGIELNIPEVDAIVIGSGSGAGVVAQTLSNDGHKVLVIEKGKYYHNSELNFNDYDGTIFTKREDQF